MMRATHERRLGGRLERHRQHPARPRRMVRDDCLPPEAVPSTTLNGGGTAAGGVSWRASLSFSGLDRWGSVKGEAEVFHDGFGAVVDGAFG